MSYSDIFIQVTKIKIEACNIDCLLELLARQYVLYDRRAINSVKFCSYFNISNIILTTKLFRRFQL